MEMAYDQAVALKRRQLWLGGLSRSSSGAFNAYLQ